MANMASSNRWDRSVGLFEYESTHHDGYDDDDWQDGFSTDYVGIDQYTDGEDGLLNLYCTALNFTEKPDINFIQIPGRTTFPIGIGKVGADLVLTFTCIDDIGETKYAEEYVNDIIEFSRRHDETSDNDAFLVVRRRISGGWKYLMWQDNSGNYDKEYLQCKIVDCAATYIDFGYWEVKVRVKGAWF